MNKRIKNIVFAELLSLGIVFILFTFFPVPASAREPATQQEFLDCAYAAKGKYYPNQGCLKFVSDFFANGYGDIVGMGFQGAYNMQDAYYCWNNYVERHEGDWNIPIGADVFFDGWNWYWDNELKENLWCQDGHVGIYVGNGQMLEASGNSVNITKINECATYCYDQTAAVQYLGWAWHPYVTITPSTPTAPTVEAHPSGDGVDVYWNNVGAEMYNIMVQNSAGTKTLCNVNTSDCFIHFGLSEGNYRVLVHAMFSTGDILASEWVYFSLSPSVVFSPWNSNVTYIGETDASIGQQIDVSGGTCTEVGMVLYDAAGQRLGSGRNPTYENPKNYFKINEELGVILTPGTTYGYQFYAIVNAKTIFSDMNYFTTSPCTHDLEHHSAVEATESSAGSIEYWYCKKCDKYFKDAACSQETTADAIDIPKLEPVIADVNGIQCRSIQEINETLAQAESPVITLVPGRTIPYTAQSGVQSMVELVKQNKRLLIGKDATLDLNGGTLCGLVIQSADLLVRDSKNGIGKVIGQFKFNNTYIAGGSSKTATLTVTGGSYIPEFDVSQNLAPGYKVERIDGWDRVQPIIYTIHYEANSGNGSFAVQFKSHGQNIALSTILPTRADHIFLGWATSADAKTAQYQPGDSYSVDADLTLYAVWEPVTFTLPASLTTIEDEAFAGIKDCVVRLPDGVSYVSPSAFDSSVRLLVKAGTSAAEAVKGLGHTVIVE